MWQFFDRLVNIALPRVRDFRGVPRQSFDGRGNYTMGLTDQAVFPEIDYNQIDRLRGLQIALVTSARNDEEGRRLLELLGVPFQRVDDPRLVGV
jgi:large subunit ribosomal protein L5